MIPTFQPSSLKIEPYFFLVPCTLALASSLYPVSSFLFLRLVLPHPPHPFPSNKLLLSEI